VQKVRGTSFSLCRGANQAEQCKGQGISGWRMFEVVFRESEVTLQNSEKKNQLQA
jgi:hypothetical protein